MFCAKKAAFSLSSLRAACGENVMVFFVKRRVKSKYLSKSIELTGGESSYH
jgi:hypothetical protein